jgi:ATP synthase subunit 6
MLKGPKIFIYDPLKQFDLYYYKTISCSYDILTWVLASNYGVAIFIISIVGLLGAVNEIYYRGYTKKLFNSYYSNIEAAVKGFLNFHTYFFYSVIILISLSLFLYNMSGLIPYSFTFTTQLFLILFYSFTILLTIWIQGVFSKKIYFFEIFLPAGIPALLIPILVILEIISTASRIFSLAIRLFANITAGHSLLKILTNFFLILVVVINVQILQATIFLFFVIVGIIGLEFIVAFLQVYVFVTLVSIYVNEL